VTEAAAHGRRHDVAIVGGGMVGASLALALRGTGVSVLLVEPFPPESAQQPSFDERTTALGNGSRRAFEALGLWERLLPEAAPIRRIHVSDAGRFGFARVEAGEFGLEALGHVVPNRAIGRELWNALRACDHVEACLPAQVQAVACGEAAVRLQVTMAGTSHWREASLVVAADGARSMVREAAGIGAVRRDYAQTAIVVPVRSDRPSDGTAFERFTTAGPMAVLPLRVAQPGHWYTIVWAAAPDDAERLMALDAAAFLQQWQQAFGWRAGRALQLGRRVAYPLSLQQADTVVAPRTVLLGNASQSLHPVAGQGFNLGLRDAAELAECLAGARASGQADLGDAALLSAYGERRRADRRGVVRFTDTLVRLFSDPRPGPALLRDLGLLGFDLLPPAKRALGRVSLGFGRSQPRLTRGMPLA
jgi:2-octaprenyl-6-methoxyphenol hydroxylase